jgi:hypothetical protein
MFYVDVSIKRHQERVTAWELDVEVRSLSHATSRNWGGGELKVINLNTGITCNTQRTPCYTVFIPSAVLPVLRGSGSVGLHVKRLFLSSDCQHTAD